MITKEQSEMIDYLIEGKSISEIAKILNKARTTIYAWLKLEQVNEELEDRKRELTRADRDKINSSVDMCINNLLELANFSNDQRVKMQANKYLLDRALGTPTIAKEEDDNSSNKDDKNKNDLKNDLEEIKKLTVIK